MTLRQRFAEGTHDQVDLFRDIEMVRRARSIFSQDADCMRIIDHHIASDDRSGDITLTDTTACATGELVDARAD